MTLARPILLVTKKSFYELYGLDKKAPDFLAALEADAGLAEELLSAHEENRLATEAAEAYLSGRGVPYTRVVDTGEVVDSRHGMVVAVGGDGTLLAASHAALDIPVVGINSRPGRSVGYFCAAEPADFVRVLDDILGGLRTPTELMRLDLHINGRRQSPPALNDILYAGANPAATTQYRLRCGEQEEMQKSSGIWVATPAGSTGGILAAAGQKRPLGDSQMQFRIREAYRGKGGCYRLEQGLFREGLSVVNLTPEATIFVDGSRISYTLNYGDVIEPRVSTHPLRIFL